MSPNDYKFGVTKIFFRPGKVSLVLTEMHKCSINKLLFLAFDISNKISYRSIISTEVTMNLQKSFYL